MDKMRWIEPSIAMSRKQERERLMTIGFPSTVPSTVAFFSQQHPTAPCPAPACVSRDQHYLVTPYSHPNSFDGSLNDMLLPYQYTKLLDDLLSEQEEPLVQQLAPVTQIEQSQIIYNTNIPFSNGERERNTPFSNAVSADNDRELASATSKSHQNAKCAMMISSRPLITPAPALSRRPPMRKGTVSYHENHIHTERQRRQDMTCLFNKLKSVLPGVQHEDLKGDRCTILEHVIDYVQKLEKKVQALGKMRAELMQGEEGALNHCHHRLTQQVSLASANNISVRPWGHVDIFITLNCPKHRGLWPNLLSLLQDTLQLDVQNVALSSTPLFWVHSIYAKIMGDDSEDVCCKVKDTLREFLANYAYNNHFMH